MRPSAGRIVHFVSLGDGREYGGKCRAAVVTEVAGPAIHPVTGAEVDLYVVGLCVLNPDGLSFNRGVVQMENGHDGGTWHWPERVE
jgi:hypothetical protein